MLPMCLTTKTAKIVRSLNKTAARAENRKKYFKGSSSYITGPIWIKLDSHVAYVSFYQTS